ncbi:Rv3654c family TadE-like protein [Arthrobacter cryoconiti]|uniref:Rv3654c family TadE-like protein n=1 Tax=Arthrobacter cryoconiti TaxID=748907 RepID=A0ABV8R108_9MICC|nr:Rv3654c family TadE-like protein [Arthrobacter cryoconiti]MCC9068057.1 hypothetical protein [Arthrobacter cryoconiti]
MKRGEYREEEPLAGSPTERERGSGTVLAAGLALAVILLLAGVLGLGQASTAAAQAATAADLAALAAADAARGLSAGDPCSIAADIAQRYGAQISRCQVQGHNLDTVQVELTILSGLPWKAYGKARAGPPPDDVLPGRSARKAVVTDVN